MKWLRKFFCAHDYRWQRNIFGDEINHSGGARSIWKCCKCKKFQFRNTLHHVTIDIEEFLKIR
jgi:hypothetical protein